MGRRSCPPPRRGSDLRTTRPRRTQSARCWMAIADAGGARSRAPHRRRTGEQGDRRPAFRLTPHRANAPHPHLRQAWRYLKAATRSAGRAPRRRDLKPRPTYGPGRAPGDLRQRGPSANHRASSSLLEACRGLSDLASPLAYCCLPRQAVLSALSLNRLILGGAMRAKIARRALAMTGAGALTLAGVIVSA